MARYLLDTNILIALGKRRPAAEQRLAMLPAGAILLSSVVVAEIEYGIAKSARPEHNRQFYDVLLRGFEVIDFDAAAAKHYGLLRLDLGAARSDHRAQRPVDCCAGLGQWRRARDRQRRRVFARGRAGRRELAGLRA